MFVLIVFLLQVLGGWDSSPGLHRERWTRLVSICSPVHLWNVQTLGLILPDRRSARSHYLLTNQMPGSIPHLTGRLSNRQTGRKSVAFIKSQPMAAWRCGPALKWGQPVFCGVCWVWIACQFSVCIQAELSFQCCGCFFSVDRCCFALV